jgi:hypothetical protein
MVNFRLNAASQVQLLSDRAHRPYPAAHLDNAHAVLLEREADDAPPVTVPREKWSFARLEGGKPVPDPRHIYLAAGFVPGRLYHVVYATSGAPVIGLGFLATRDFASFLRHELSRPDNPCAGQIRHAYAPHAPQKAAGHAARPRVNGPEARRYTAGALADRAADRAGASSALSISSKVRPLGS